MIAKVNFGAMKGGKYMERKEALLLTIEQTCELANLGQTKVRELADESGAVRKIGKSYRINRKVFFDYIEREYAI